MTQGILAQRRSRVLSIAEIWPVGAIVGIVGLAFVVGPSVIDGRIPGDLGDARFNSYILEHFFRWITDQDASFWNAGFFYPFPRTIAFSDNFLGNGFVYAIFRSLGFVREDAFRLWYITGFVVNFAAGDYALLRLGYSRFPAALGAFLFTFGLPITAQEGHAQLIYRFGVPLAVLALQNFRSRRRLYQLAMVAFWIGWQFYCSIYIGYFLSLLLLAIVFGHFLCHRGGPIAAMRSYSVNALQLLVGTTARGMAVFLFAVLALGTAMLLLCMPYIEVSHLYGFHRRWLEIALMLPRPASYLLANNSRIWPSSGSLFDALPMRHEHAMFIGIAPLLTVAIAITLRLANRTKFDHLFAPYATAVLLIGLLTVWTHGSSAYTLFASLPGVDAIRGVTRIITVLIFPCSILFASSLAAIIAARLRPSARFVIVALLSIVTLFECSYVVHYMKTKDDWQQHLSSLAARVPQQVPEAPILLLASQPDDPASWVGELDAMLFSQDRGWRTLNGYSGNVPPRPELSGACQDGAVALVSGLAFVGRDTEQNYADLMRHLVTVGYPRCDEASLLERPKLTPFAGPLPAQLMANVSLLIDHLSLVNDRIDISAKIINKSSISLPAYSTTGMPIRLSPRITESHATPAVLQNFAGWNSRQPIGFDVPPGTTHSIVFSVAIPTRPGTYRVALSMVQDGVAWFHDRGMHIPISTQMIEVAADHTVRVSDEGH